MSDILGTGSGQNDLRIAAGQFTSVTANDLVATGLRKVKYAVASLEDSPVLTCEHATAVVGTQATPGSININTWMPTATGDATPIAATTFGKKVNWMAFGY